MRLYGYFRSTSSYRVRIALALKGISCEQWPIHLVRGGGEQFSPAYLALNPTGRVPTLVLDDGTVLIQSPAILEYLDEAFPRPPLLPASLEGRAQVRAVAAIIGCDIHPLNNVSPLNVLRRELGHTEEDVSAWIARWIHAGFRAVEQWIGAEGYCFGPEPGLADIYLIPQVFSARRFNVPLDAYPRILRVDALAAEHPAFRTAHPAHQADAE
ncbi:maleylacetoacetate isomerase [Xanthobacter dioxanivorans]|uniref:Maleylacetoacetate isomerase n=1 Tax=Xanthobacter dioxanivorans TaxID=2528964 RepID=A0A974PNV4_9HYPH|nr:maleylacetoacetate isomerase [Xanthobacter dioxanivorans]QRG07005.1 maleylacetoacetate isomerase [Xanthobacter dioxanivorans]